MVYDHEDVLDLAFHALSDRTRRDILKRLVMGEMGISQLSSTYDMTLAAVSKHVKVLEKAGLVTTSKEGRVHRCVMRFEPLEAASAQIEFYTRFWQNQLDNMDQYIQHVLSQREEPTQRRTFDDKRRQDRSDKTI